MKYGIIAALIFAGLVAAVDASAEDEQGFFAGRGIGQFNLEIDDVVTTVDDYDSDDTAYQGVRRLARKQVAGTRARLHQPRQLQRRDPPGYHG